MNRRLEAKDDIDNFFHIICLNGAYCYDGMNEEKFTKCKILNEQKTNERQISSNFVSSKLLLEEITDENDDVIRDAFYQVQMRPRSFICNTPLIEALFSLDNYKFWLLNFIYNFMYKSFDMNKMHYIEGDTDSLYWAVAGKITDSPQIDRKQGFHEVIKDEKFYNENVYRWFPSDTYSTDNSNPTFETKLEKKKFDKKFGGVAIENEKDRMVALCPKMYYLSNVEDLDAPYSNGIDGHYTAKGINKKQNPLEWIDYIKALEKESEIKMASNTNLQVRNGEMSKVIIEKKAITLVHTKMRVLPDFKTCITLKTPSSSLF
jgi:hypothetical protein